MDDVAWEELRKELITPEDEPFVEEQRRRLIARQRAYRLAGARQRRGLRAGLSRGLPGGFAQKKMPGQS